MTLQEMREAKAKKLEEARALQAKDDFTAEDQTAFDAITAEIEALNKRIDNYLTVNQLSDAADPRAVSRAVSPSSIVVEAKPVYANLGEQLLDVRSMTLNDNDSPRARDRFQKVVNAASGQSTGIDSEGGFLVETDKARGIIETAVETGIFSSRCTRQPISANADSFSYMTADDRSRAAGKFNGIDVFRKGETDSMSSSGTAKLKEHEVRVEDMYGLIYVTNRMLRDAVAMSEYAKRLLRKQFAWKMDYEIFYGDGSGKCLGITNSGLPVTVAKEACQAADTVVAGNVVKMLARFQGDISKAAWFVNKDVLPQLPLMTLGQQPVFIPGGSFANAPFGTLLGLPIVTTEFNSTLGDLWDIMLGDFSEYMLVSKGGMEEAESIHVRFLNDETAFRFITRFNGQPIQNAPITPYKGNNTLSPFVNLAARA